MNDFGTFAITFGGIIALVIIGFAFCIHYDEYKAITNGVSWYNKEKGYNATYLTFKEFVALYTSLPSANWDFKDARFNQTDVVIPVYTVKGRSYFIGFKTYWDFRKYQRFYYSKKRKMSARITTDSKQELMKLLQEQVAHDYEALKDTEKMIGG